MKAQALAEVGSWIAVNATALIFADEKTRVETVNRYWTSSRCRLQRWATALKMFDVDLDESITAIESGKDLTAAHNPLPAIEIVVQEIVISELLTRVFAAILVTADDARTSSELHGIAHGIHVGHLEIRSRAFRILHKSRRLDETGFDRLNKLRSRIERWTDLFLAQLPVCDDAVPFAFDASRVNDFRLENKESTPVMNSRRQQIFSASLADDLASVSVRYPANPELNRDIVSGVIACFPGDRFEARTLPKTIRSLWVEQPQDDAMVLIDRITALEINGVRSTRH